MELVDFGPATTTLRDLVLATTDDQLSARTPCPAYSVADLCDHIAGLTLAFTASARKTPLEDGDPSADGSRLEQGWRERVAANLAALAQAWTDPEAYEGMTQAGPIELPAPVAAQVALNEVVVHGWDLAAATGRGYAADPTAVETCRAFLAAFDAPADDAPVLDHLLGLAGRDPAWTPTAAG